MTGQEEPCDHDWDLPGYECECGDGNCLVVCRTCGQEDRACEN